MYVSSHVSRHTCGEQRATSGSMFPPSSMWVEGINSECLSLEAGY